MPGSPSRDTFPNAKSKNYTKVLAIGGATRRLFDAELNEMQDIAKWRRQQGWLGLHSRRPGPATQPAMALDEMSYRLGRDSFLVQPISPPDNYKVQVFGGSLLAEGELVQMGDVDTVAQALTLFTGGDAPGTTAFVYVDVQEVVQDSTADASIIDPGYGYETAQRVKQNATITFYKGVSMPVAPTGHVYVLLATVTKDAAIIVTDDIAMESAVPSLLDNGTDVAALDAAVSTQAGTIASLESDVADLQAALAGIGSGLFTLTGAKYFVPWQSAMFNDRTATGYTWSGEDGDLAFSSGNAGDNIFLLFPMPLPVGAVLQEVHILFSKSTITNHNVVLTYKDLSGAQPYDLSTAPTGRKELFNVNIPASSSGYRKYAAATGLAHTVLEGVYSLRLQSHTAMRILGVLYVYDSLSASIRL